MATRDLKLMLRQVLREQPMQFRTRRELAEAARLHERSCYAALRQLADEGVVEVRDRRRPDPNPHGGRAEYEYRLSVAYRPIDLQRQVAHFEQRLTETLGRSERL